MRMQSVEEIDVVLGRFQAWAGSPVAVDAKPGIRELSEEEALRSSRYRWKGSERPPSKNAASAASSFEHSAARLPSELRKGTAARKAAAGKNSARRIAKDTVGAVKSRASSKAAHVPNRENQIAPEFRDVLASAVRPAKASLPASLEAQPLEGVRHVAISVRLDAAERALIKTRAAEAGITTSAYIRQCALEVEQMRAQVQQVIAAMERSAPVQGAVRAPGFFGRLARRFFPRREPVLALRA